VTDRVKDKAVLLWIYSVCIVSSDSRLKVKVSSCLPKYHALKKYGAEKVELHAFLARH